MRVAFAESLGAAKTFAAGADQHIDGSRELVALGGATSPPA